MSETDAMDFYNRVTNSSDDDYDEYVLVHESNAEVTVRVTKVDRKKLLDELNKLPDAMLETIEEAEGDEEEAREKAQEQNMLSSVNGDTVRAFENICTESIEHEDWTSHHVEDIVDDLAFEVLFEIGSKAIEKSFDDQGSIKDFHEPDSDKSS